MRLLQRAAAMAVTFAMAAAAASTLPDLSTATQTTPSATTGSASNTGSAAATTTGSGSSAAATTGSTGTSGSASKSGITITGSGSTAVSTGSIPTITGTASATSGGALPTGLPTLSGAVQPVTVTVPNLSSAPFMKTSNMPDGTVFIVVGAILGFMAMSVLLWRGLVAWSLHRSVKRAASQQNMSDTKALFRTPGPPPSPFYKYSDRDSTISLSGLGHKKQKSNRPGTGGAGGASASTANLFFSPTAGAAGAGVGAGSRGSNYLPAGYYAAGAAAAGNGQGHVPIGGLGHNQGISMSTLRPESQGYGRARSLGHSPPDSPGLSAQRGHMTSSSTLNLSQGYSMNERAPSAYLEDLIDGDNTIPVPPAHGSHLRDDSNSLGRY